MTFDINRHLFIIYYAFSERSLNYNHLNLVSEVGDASGTLAYYTYLSDGTKLSAEKPDDSGTVYRGSLVYSKDGNGNLSLDCVLTDGGSIAAGRNASGNITAYHPLYHLADHLGSVRAVVDGDTGTVIEASDYYPFGKRIPSPATESAAVFGSVSVTKPAEVTADPNPHSVASTSSATVVTATTAIRLRSRAALKSTFRDFRRLLRLIPSGMTRMKPVTGSFERRYAV